MLVFARFVLRDNGLPIHIATEHVTQIRQTIDGEPAIYILNKETPIIVEGSLEATVRKLEAAASGLPLVEQETPSNVVPLDVALIHAPAPEPAAPPSELPTVVSITTARAPAKPKRTAAKSEPAKKTPARKPTAATNAPERKTQSTPAAEPDSDLDWFKGLT